MTAPWYSPDARELSAAEALERVSRHASRSAIYWVGEAVRSSLKSEGVFDHYDHRSMEYLARAEGICHTVETLRGVVDPDGEPLYSFLAIEACILALWLAHQAGHPKAVLS